MSIATQAIPTTFAEIFGPERIYAPRAHDQNGQWISRDPMLLDSITGNQLAVMGEMPIVCSAGFDHPAGWELLADAGFEPPPCRYHYAAGHALEATQRAVAETGGKLVLQHAYPTGVVPPESQWIDAKLLCFLNNKANLAKIATPKHVPPRVVIEAARFFASDAPELPVVIKAATDDSTGGGAAVMICRTRDDLAAAAKMLAPCEWIVVESLLDIARNPCLHFAVMCDGHVVYLGFADQDITEAGKYRGNWMELGSLLPPAMVEPAEQIVHDASTLGYRGIVGIDVVLTRDGRIYVLDLNFRVNGSTAAAMLAPAILQERGPVMLHLRTFKGVASASEMAESARLAIGRGQLIPLSLFDPITAGYPNQPPLLRAMVVGSSTDEVLAIESTFKTVGLI